jgi:nitrogen fixation protein NifU and related proteins|tara:strand:- start:139 stop:510 length:372 start_codon:yes stop_codon:yes gene_type:complete
MINQQVIKFAADTSNYGIKKNSSFVATSKNKICGDKITVELEIKKKIIKKMSYETDSCVFCQASASLLSKSIKNKHTNINTLSSILDTTIKNKDFKKLLENKERISCIMLPFEAFQKAMNNTK